MSDEQQPDFIIIPPDQLSEDALAALIDEFILRDGTDYGSVELSHDSKRQRAKVQLDKGYVKIVYSPLHESCTIKHAKDLGA